MATSSTTLLVEGLIAASVLLQLAAVLGLATAGRYVVRRLSGLPPGIAQGSGQGGRA
jgi:hypothetical protein